MILVQSGDDKTMTEQVVIQFKKVHPAAIVPRQMRHGDSGYDLTSTEAVVIPPLNIRTVSTGIALAIPYDYEGQIRARSGLAQQAIMLMNGVGTIDSGYRGEVKVLLGNMSTKKTFQINKGYRIAQLIIVPVIYPTYEKVDELPPSERGIKGFGSTGEK
jgi:dUTP pyrophosphatase